MISKRMYDLAPLSPRESETLTHVAMGLTNKQISKKMGISMGTVDAHRGQIISKLAAENSANAVYVACKLELL